MEPYALYRLECELVARANNGSLRDKYSTETIMLYIFYCYLKFYRKGNATDDSIPDIKEILDQCGFRYTSERCEPDEVNRRPYTRYSVNLKEEKTDEVI